MSRSAEATAFVPEEHHGSGIAALSLATERPRGVESPLVLRFRPSERHVHWALAIPFMVCYTTALILVTVYNPNPTFPLRYLVSWTHRLSGTCLFAFPALTLLRHRRDASLHVSNIRQVWRWTVEDLKWLCLIGPASFSRKVTLPHQGKFNAGEKINFMSVSGTYSIYILTGLGIWSGVGSYTFWLLHFSMALCATPLLLGHVFMALVNPDTRPGLPGMITGFVDRHWASHHYHHWYQEHYGAEVLTEPVVPEAAAASEERTDRPSLPVPRPEPAQPAAAVPSPARPKPNPKINVPAAALPAHGGAGVSALS